MVPSSAARVIRRAASTAKTAKVADVAIVGAGIWGMNTAYQLKRRSPELNVQVFEQAPALGYGSSGYSTGFLRAYYSFDETMALALDGIGAYKRWDEYTGLGDEAESKFTETGALWMLGYTENENQLMSERLSKFGVGSEVMDAEDVAKKWPVLDTTPFPEFNDDGDLIERDHGKFSAVHEYGCGHMDSNLCLSDMKKVLDREGVPVHFSTPVASFDVSADGSKCIGIKLASGEVINAGAVVNCAGPWFAKLNGASKRDVKTTTEMLPTRIHVGHKHIEGQYLDLPFVADGWGNSGIYFMPRRQNSQLVFGSVAHRFESEVVDPDDYNTSLDPDIRQDYLTCLFHRLPDLPRSGQIHGFAHMYTVNQNDVHPVVGESDIDGLFLAYGESGHGFKLAPAIGSLLAQQITSMKTTDWETSIPLDFLHPNREPLSMKVKTHFA